MGQSSLGYLATMKSTLALLASALPLTIADLGFFGEVHGPDFHGLRPGGAHLPAGPHHIPFHHMDPYPHHPPPPPPYHHAEPYYPSYHHHHEPSYLHVSYQHGYNYGHKYHHGPGPVVGPGPAVGPGPVVLEGPGPVDIAGAALLG